MGELICNLCKDNSRFCIIKQNGVNPKDCPCRDCDVRGICDKTCNDHYGLRYVHGSEKG